MASYGQFCAVARAHEVLGGRWTLLVVRELLCGSRRFNDIRRGIPRISRTVLSEQLHDLIEVGAVARTDGPEYELTEAGRELTGLVAALGRWGQRWLPHQAAAEDIDLKPLLADMQRRVRFEALKACAASVGGQEALAHAASISTGGAPTIVVVVDAA